MKKLLHIFLILSTGLYAQTGPGGVGTSASNKLWFKADAAVYSDAGTTTAVDGSTVQQWNDQSGNTTNATQTTSGARPIYNTNVINGKPAIRFDGADDWMGITIDVPETNFSQFVVFETVGGDGSGAFITITDPVSATAGSHDRQFGLTGNKLDHRLWNNQIITSAASYSNNQLHIADINVSSTTGQTIYADGAAVASGNKTSSDFNWQTGMVIGGHSNWGHVNCNIPEIIFYNILLNSAQRIIVENYLASKYGKNIANDKYTYDAIHGNDVAGIGRVDASNTHTDAMSANIFRVLGASSLSDGDYLLFGHDNGSYASWTTTEAPNSGVNIQRLAREWRLDETDGGGGNGVGNITFAINKTLLPALPAGHTKYVLMLDADGDFSSGASVYELTSPGGNQYYTTSSIDVADGYYVAIGCVVPTVEFSASASSGFETSNASLTASLNYITKSNISVVYTTADGTASAPADYTAVPSGTLTIPAGSSSANFSVTIINDVTVENDETFTITLSSPSAGISLGVIDAHTYTIHDDDNARKIYFSAASSNGDESISPVNIVVSIDLAQVDPTNPTTVDYVVTGGTATGGGVDYTLTAGTATISATNQTTAVSLSVNDDALYEIGETIIITLSNPTNGNLSSVDPITFTYTIDDNDPPPVIEFNTTSSSGSESSSPVNFQVDLSFVSGFNAGITYTVTGTATGGGTDYTLASGTFSITAGNLSGNITAIIKDDAIVEFSETIIITLGSPTHCILGTNTTHTYTIIDNDVFGYDGPGGVGKPGNNKLWFRADENVYSDAGTTPATDGVSVRQWNDESGGANNISQATAGNRPIYKANIINGKPVLRFDGVDDWMGLNINVPETDFSQFVVLKTIGSDGAGAAITITDAISSAAGSHDRQFGLSGNKLSHRLWNNQIITSASNYNDNATHIAYLQVNASIGQTMYANGTSVATGNKTSSDFNWQTSMIVGGHTAWGFLNCDIPEIIFYSTTLNTTQRIIVENYLGAKYGLAIANDKYAYQAAHGNDVSGIGMESISDFHTDAKGSSIVRINTPSSVDAGDYLLWGHDGASPVGVNTADVPVGIENRHNRVWRANKTNDVGTVTVMFDISGFTVSSINDIELLIDNDGTFAAGATRYTTGRSYSAPFLSFTGVNFNDGDYFTLGSSSELTPLPIELLSFDASYKNDKVNISWTTSSEINNDYFTVEKTKDGIVYETVATVKGGGNSTTTQRYSTVDEQPYIGLSYYRLKQTDFDGKFSYSDLVSVTVDQKDIEVVPNPVNASQLILITMPGYTCTETELTIELYDMKGILVFNQKVEIQSDNKNCSLNLILPENISTGMYIISVSDGNYRSKNKLLVN